ncbi:MAG: tetratricopeptide repeat protein [Candidatus Thorarchaeota archaeon]
MSDPKPKEIIQAEELITGGKKDEALVILRNYQRSAWMHFFRGEASKGLEVALQSKDLIHKIGTQSDIANNFFILGHMYVNSGNSEAAISNGLKSVDLYEQINDKERLAASFTLVGNAYQHNYEFDLSIEYCKKSLSIDEITPIDKVLSLVVLGNVYGMRGDFTQTINYSKEGLKIAKEGGFEFYISFFEFFLGLSYFIQDKFDEAFNYLKSCLISAEKSNHNVMAFALYLLVFMGLEKDLLEQAEDYLNQLKELEEKTDNKFVTYFYYITKGVVLMSSGRTRDLAEAETLLKSVVEDDTFTAFNIQNLIQNHTATLHLCNLYMEELGKSNNIKVIKDIEPLISIFSKYADTFQSEFFLFDVKRFQAKLDLIQMKFDSAKKLMIEAQQLAESSNNQFYAQLVSIEHDNLLEQQELWNKLKNTNAPFSERIKLASFDGVMDRIQGKRLEIPLDLKPESPVFLLIITESGDPLFSYSFSRELSFEDDIISSFISAFNTFSGELFSKGLDRARFGDYIILIEKVNSYSVCYLFKGQSYPAKQKLTILIEEMKKKKSFLQTLNKFSKISQVAELKDVPLLESLMTKIFSSKTYTK